MNACSSSNVMYPSWFASILSKEYFETMMKKGTPNAADVYPIGTGPFEFVSYQKDATIRYKAFDKHWKGRPKADNLVYSITRDATARYAKLKTGSAMDAVCAAVVELGTSNPGEIARLTHIAAPDVAMVTSVGPAHLSSESDEDAVRIGVDPGTLRAETEEKIGDWNRLGRELCGRFLDTIV